VNGAIELNVLACHPFLSFGGEDHGLQSALGVDGDILPGVNVFPVDKQVLALIEFDVTNVH
jgi:hypothetical protein